MQPLPHPDGNGTRPVSPNGRPETPASGPSHPPAGGVSRLDRVTLQLGVAMAMVIAVCSYGVSATSLYALGLQAGYSWWQAAAVPVVADGPAIYGMFRIISRSRRGAKGAGYGWLLVIAGTLASIGGNVAHAQDDLVARAIAAAIPLAVLAMLEGLKGDTQEVARLATHAVPAATPVESADATVVRRADRPAPTGSADSPVDIPAVGQLAARPQAADTSVQDRLQAASVGVRADGRPWTARTLAEAAGCGRTTAARFLQAQRAADGEATP
jgi:Protein of unknown function (DUF2637)